MSRTVFEEREMALQAMGPVELFGAFVDRYHGREGLTVKKLLSIYLSAGNEVTRGIILTVDPNSPEMNRSLYQAASATTLNQALRKGGDSRILDTEEFSIEDAETWHIDSTGQRWHIPLDRAVEGPYRDEPRFSGHYHEHRYTHDLDLAIEPVERLVNRH